MTDDISKVDSAILAEVTSNITKVSDCDATALILTTPAFGFGGNWALLPKTKSDYADIMNIISEEIKKDMTSGKQKKASLYKVKGGSVLTVNPAWIDNTMKLLAPKTYAQGRDRFMSKVLETQKTEPAICAKLLSKIASGKVPEFKKVQGGYKGWFGLYCTNSQNVLSVNGVPFPAVKLDVVTFANICESLSSKVAVHVVIAGKPYTVKQICSSPQLLSEYLTFAMTSDSTVATSNGLFMPLLISGKGV